MNPNLENLIDWGWFGVIAKPLFLILQWMNVSFVHNYGWSIILITIIINVAMFPLKLANLKSMRKMQLLQPEISRINEKYKGISMSDPRAAQKQQETMDLYKKNGVNPMGGCIPMLIQLPFLYAFYRVLSVAIEMRGAGWLWIADLSQPEHFAIHFLPIVMIAYQLHDAEDDADGGRRPQPAESHAVHAAHVGFLLLVGVERAGVILAFQQFGPDRPAVVFQ